MSIKNEDIGSLRIGSYIVMDGAACTITKMDRSAPGKHGHSKYRVEAVGMIDNVKRVQMLTGHDKVEVPIIEKKNAQVLSISGNSAQVMDLESYETFEAIVPSEMSEKVIEGGQVVYWDILGKKILKQTR